MNSRLYIFHIKFKQLVSTIYRQYIASKQTIKIRVPSEVILKYEIIIKKYIYIYNIYSVIYKIIFGSTYVLWQEGKNDAKFPRAYSECLTIIFVRRIMPCFYLVPLPVTRSFFFVDRSVIESYKSNESRKKGENII